VTSQITLVTGLPGNGKTLYAIQAVKHRAEETKRQVYYHGIEILDPVALPWEELQDAREWHKLPTGSIVVLDEAQKTFVKRATGSVVPEYVSALETLRHSGIELWLITQHPMLIDSHARKLIGDHRHLVRIFGSKSATVHKWNNVQEQCDKVRTTSEKTTFVYPSAVFAWYKSAEIHTIQRKLPKAFWVLVTVPFLIGLCAWGTYRFFANRIEKAQGVKPVDGQLVKVGTGGSGGAVTGKQTLKEWLADQVPRLPGLPHTAPVYDKITTPVAAPYPAACVEMGELCRCYTQQGTILNVGVFNCRHIVDNGFFVSWQQAPDGLGKAEGRREGVPKEKAPVADMLATRVVETPVPKF
jgi:hypothetical protein